MDEKRTKEVVNSLFVDVFNSILQLEDTYISSKINDRVTVNEIHVIEAIMLNEKKSMGAIAKRLLITEGTLTTSVNRLVQKGYLTRERDKSDRRVFRLGLTEKAKEVMEIHAHFHNRMIEHVIEDPNIDESLIDSLEHLKIFFGSLKEEYEKDRA